MKKILCIITVIIAAGVIFSACQKQAEDAEPDSEIVPEENARVDISPSDSKLKDDMPGQEKTAEQAEEYEAVEENISESADMPEG